MSYIRIWVHLVFATKNREPLLTKEVRYKVYEHMIENCKEKSIFLQTINGYTDHVHCLISLGRAQTISKVTQLIKGESSFWINQNQLTTNKFMWQDDYYAVSVSESNLQAVINYIKNQEVHHTKKTFDHEVQEFVKIYGFSVLK
ncbi:IS200/IS605 family transposase [Pedobacter cryotolerans]|uniref:IS200/IS605 family transposase n=1 Tax=Pedobacter cryotolerans TaxID=2571270 RepID=A0A4U1C8P6_9SPHI|nr:IS200/IS605 family transposase [Pedobacter cryotolerans]TKC02079.1 IS200/IS605 family transposase [Pedobacter cryotolerans]